MIVNLPSGVGLVFVARVAGGGITEEYKESIGRLDAR